jgi:hypothetical protein
MYWCHPVLNSAGPVMISVLNDYRCSDWQEFISCVVAAKLLGKEGDDDDLPIFKEFIVIVSVYSCKFNI